MCLHSRIPHNIKPLWIIHAQHHQLCVVSLAARAFVSHVFQFNFRFSFFCETVVVYCLLLDCIPLSILIVKWADKMRRNFANWTTIYILLIFYFSLGENKLKSWNMCRHLNWSENPILRNAKKKIEWIERNMIGLLYVA